MFHEFKGDEIFHRYVSFIDYEKSDEPQAMTHKEYSELSNDVQNSVLGDEWVWQFATSKEQAISNHYAKHDLCMQSQDAGLPELHTY